MGSFREQQLVREPKQITSSDNLNVFIMQKLMSDGELATFYLKSNYKVLIMKNSKDY